MKSTAEDPNKNTRWTAESQRADLMSQPAWQYIVSQNLDFYPSYINYINMVAVLGSGDRCAF